jgi:putative ABC transport system permease protein
MAALLRELSWPELRYHAWRHLSAWFAVVLGVALAFAVHLINESALGEFSAAVRVVSGQADFELRARHRSFGGGFDELIYARVAAHPRVALASPVLEVETYALDPQGRRVTLRVLGVDALLAAPLSPNLLPRPAPAADRLTVLDPEAMFLNAAAARRLGSAGSLSVGSAAGVVEFHVRGSVAADGPPLAVVDIAGAQAAFGALGRVSRIDVRLASGAQRDAVLRDLDLPPSVRVAAADESALRISNLSRAYRVNLTVLALVALFTGAFLVFSILALSVSRRTPQLALLGVLGLTAHQRLMLVLAESALLGLAGSVAGLALGTALAALGLWWLAGDLGGGYFPGVAPQLQFSAGAAALYGLLGVGAAIAGGWLPARAAQRIAPAQALKGLAPLGAASASPGWATGGALLVAAALAFAPPWHGLPLAAYASVALLLIGGIAAAPAGVDLLLRAVPEPRTPIMLLAVERARWQRQSATIAVAGIVASLALAVALTVMVASFRTSVSSWLDQVLPADLYARTASSSASAETLHLPADLLEQVRSLAAIERVTGQRVFVAQLDPARPGVTVLARPIGDPTTTLPLVGRLLAAAPQTINVYVSEAMVSLYGAAPGTRFELPLPDGRLYEVHVRGVWRDYARQHGAVAIDAADYRALSGDTRINDLALWLRPGADRADVQAAIERLVGTAGTLEFAAAGELRSTSLRIFDRSFAVTYWLQAIAIGIGLFGIAASFSSQVLARRKEFGVLMHLGLTRSQVRRMVALEGALWATAGAVLGVLLGLAVSVVLVKVVNPQSFHWTMELAAPWGRLTLLGLVVIASATLATWLAARASARGALAQMVKEDW